MLSVSDGTAVIDVTDSTQLVIYDEAVIKGTVSILNITGVGATVSVTSGTANLDVPGVIAYDEGELAGTVTKINVTGTAAALSVSSGTAVISIPGLVAEVAFTVIALIIFNFFPQIIGFGFLKNEKWTFLPLLSDAFFRYLPFINALWGLQITLNLILLQRGRWETATRWLRFTLTGLGIALAVIMLAGPDLISPIGELMGDVGPGFSAAAARVLSWLPRIASSGRSSPIPREPRRNVPRGNFAHPLRLRVTGFGAD